MKTDQEAQISPRYVILRVSCQGGQWVRRRAIAVGGHGEETVGEKVGGWY